ncbi:cupin domain-containing protein [Maridesulfovibrio sp.]|uniref:cupin domain-containing protein n=1 Tax=Maridesulfovibrio sp. TaxID=2795000 RepID=UPI002A18A041|nr:cupin domain-containing protein [Maridesulfovibrio sp.]
MISDEFAMLVSNGCVETVDGPIFCTELDWNPHAAFEGVALKHIVTGENTAGQLSCHIVRIEPGCVLESHTHDPQWELHEVIKGSGVATVSGKESDYHPGKSSVIPSGQTHKVQAGDEGLILLAKFFPALL